MPLVQAKCTNCGANLEVDSKKDAAICEYCGVAFIVEKAINHYNIANAQIRADVVNVNLKNKIDDFVVEGGILTKYKGNDKKVIIPNIVKVIQYGAFNDNLNVESVVIPDSVEQIWVNTIEKQVFTPFLNCTYLSDYQFTSFSLKTS